MGYYKDKERNPETPRDGYWHSGDRGFIDEQGCLHFSVRVKDYLRVGGENMPARLQRVF
jgi:acyl-CoA synthetase (AMP-forming)/AMP-acid ligase II